MLYNRKLIVIGMLIVLIFLGIHSASYAAEKVKAPTLVFASGAVGGTWHPIASAIVEKAHENMVGRPITVRPGAGGSPRPFRTAWRRYPMQGRPHYGAGGHGCHGPGTDSGR